MSILIAAPTYDQKEYCIERWIRAVSRINYQPVNVLLVDTSDSLDFMARWRSKVPMEHIDLRGETPDRKVALGMEYIRKTFLEGTWDWWWDVEQDILVQPNALDVMLQHANGVDFVAAPYKHRIEDRFIDGCFGCSLFSRKIARVSFADAPKDSHTDVWWREKVLGKYRINEMPRHILYLEHVNS